MIRAHLRGGWVALHRWVGLVIASVLLMSGLSGSLLVLARPLDKLLHPQLFVVGGNPTQLAPVVADLRARFGPAAAFTLRLPARNGDSLQVSVSGGGWTGTIYLDPSTGRELGRRDASEGLFNKLFELHSSLFAGDTGKAVLALAAGGYVAMLVSGLVLWWPLRWRHAFRVRTTASGITATLFDLHRVAGAALGLLVLVSVASGAYMAWRPLSSWVSQLAGLSSSPPQLSARSNGAATASLNTALSAARAVWPHGTVSTIHVPAQGPLRLRVRLPGDPHPIGMSTLWVDPQDGRMLAARPWSALDPGTRAFSFVYPLHTGELAGVPTLLAAIVAGVALAGFAVSGVWLWCRRRHGRQSAGTGTSIGAPERK